MYADMMTALASIKTAADLAGLVLKAKVDAAVRDKAIELQSGIISLQSLIMTMQTQNQDLLAENNRLKQELIDTQNWEAEKAKYELKEVSTNRFVYVMKPDQAGSSPSPWLCTQCFDNKKQKSILQRDRLVLPSEYSFQCHNCRSSYLLRVARP